MSTNGVLSIEGIQTQIPEGSKAFNLSIAMSAVTEELENTFASASSWTVTVPSGCAGCAIVPPASNTTGLTLKGVSGDTGIGIDPAGPTILNFPVSTPASFVLTSAGAITGAVEVSFF